MRVENSEIQKICSFFTRIDVLKVFADRPFCLFCTSISTCKNDKIAQKCVFFLAKIQINCYTFQSFTTSSKCLEKNKCSSIFCCSRYQTLLSSSFHMLVRMNDKNFHYVYETPNGWWQALLNNWITRQKSIDEITKTINSTDSCLSAVEPLLQHWKLFYWILLMLKEFQKRICIHQIFDNTRHFPTVNRGATV